MLIIKLVNKIISLKLILFLFFLFGCETIKKKSDEIAKKENQKLSKYIGKTLDDLKTDLGSPTEDFKNEKGNFVLIYKSKKYGISCERKFEINSENIIVGFTSSGCI